MKLHVLGPLPQPFRIMLGHMGRVIFVVAPCNVQHGCTDALVCAIFPVARQAPADADHTSNRIRVSGCKSIVQRHCLREPNQEPPLRRDVELAAGLGCNAFRLSVEWARLEPRPEVYDDAAREKPFAKMNRVAARPQAEKARKAAKRAAADPPAWAAEPSSAA